MERRPVAAALSGVQCHRAQRLRSVVAERPANAHHVLLLTDGGATQYSSFEADIESIQQVPGLNFFQVPCTGCVEHSVSKPCWCWQIDSLGYGPWLNARTVEFLATTTGGEAVLVQQPEGEKMKSKILGCMARSLLRGASKMSIEVRIRGCILYAV